VPWDAPEFVCRAVQLIIAGALDETRGRRPIWVTGSDCPAAICVGCSASISACLIVGFVEIDHELLVSH
jgi:hypothetical protein